MPKNALTAAFSEKTKFILLKAPQNLAAKVYSRVELQFIADLVIKHNTCAVCDEVYEHIVFDTARHILLISLPGMRNRCIRIGSAGKTFSMTAWKVNFIISSAALLSTIAKAHRFITFTAPTYLQRAVTMELEQDDIYFTKLTTT